MIDTENLTTKIRQPHRRRQPHLARGRGRSFRFPGTQRRRKNHHRTHALLPNLKTSGKAQIGDFTVETEADCLKIRKMVGLLPENVGLYDSLSAYRNLDFYGKLYEVPEAKRRENIERLLKLLGIWERREDAVGAFSKGTKQKIAIARALIHDPKCCFWTNQPPT